MFLLNLITHVPWNVSNHLNQGKTKTWLSDYTPYIYVRKISYNMLTCTAEQAVCCEYKCIIKYSKMSILFYRTPKW